MQQQNFKEIGPQRNSMLEQQFKDIKTLQDIEKRFFLYKIIGQNQGAVQIIRDIQNFQKTFVKKSLKYQGCILRHKRNTQYLKQQKYKDIKRFFTEEKIIHNFKPHQLLKIEKDLQEKMQLLNSEIHFQNYYIIIMQKFVPLKQKIRELKGQKGFSFKQKIFQQLCKIYNQFLKKEIQLSDSKQQNTLLKLKSFFDPEKQETYEIKLCDFGFMKFIKQKKLIGQNLIGTYHPNQQTKDQIQLKDVSDTLYSFVEWSNYETKPDILALLMAKQFINADYKYLRRKGIYFQEQENSKLNEKQKQKLNDQSHIAFHYYLIFKACETFVNYLQNKQQNIQDYEDFLKILNRDFGRIFEINFRIQYKNQFQQVKDRSQNIKQVTSQIKQQFIRIIGQKQWNFDQALIQFKQKLELEDFTIESPKERDKIKKRKQRLRKRQNNKQLYHTQQIMYTFYDKLNFQSLHSRKVNKNSFQQKLQNLIAFIWKSQFDKKQFDQNIKYIVHQQLGKIKNQEQYFLQFRVKFYNSFKLCFQKWKKNKQKWDKKQLCQYLNRVLVKLIDSWEGFKNKYVKDFQNYKQLVQACSKMTNLSHINTSLILNKKIQSQLQYNEKEKIYLYIDTTDKQILKKIKIQQRQIEKFDPI